MTSQRYVFKDKDNQMHASLLSYFKYIILANGGNLKGKIRRIEELDLKSLDYLR